MLAFARALSEQLSTPLPDEVINDLEACLEWIKDSSAQEHSTAEQRRLAEKISAIKGVSIPVRILGSRLALAKWIEQNNKPE